MQSPKSILLDTQSLSILLLHQMAYIERYQNNKHTLHYIKKSALLHSYILTYFPSKYSILTSTPKYSVNAIICTCSHSLPMGSTSLAMNVSMSKVKSSITYGRNRSACFFIAATNIYSCKHIN